jgi:hypothetical protein
MWVVRSATVDLRRSGALVDVRLGDRQHVGSRDELRSDLRVSMMSGLRCVLIASRAAVQIAELLD